MGGTMAHSMQKNRRGGFRKVDSRTAAIRLPTPALILALFALLCLGPLTDALRAETRLARLDAPQFVRDVQPLLRRHCYRCHGSRKQAGGLQLNRRESASGVADSGELIIVQGDGDASLIIKRLTNHGYGDLMPRDAQPLSDDEIELLRRWIDGGADWPDAASEPVHWAYQPVVRPEIPDAPEASAALSPIDRFVLRRLDQSGLQPSPPEDPARLLRRVSLMLIGLPPSTEEVDAFVSDPSPDAYERAVDRLLESPRYGERWATPWLDLARYADSNGFQADQIRDNWAYRDWVIRAMNADMPFDQFVIDQLAGDLRPRATIDQRIATGFHRMTTCNVEAGVHPEANRTNQIVDRVNTTATVFLGTTMECAQCHDHKYDPFTQRDYYRLFAYFNNTPLEVKHTSGVTWDFYGPTMELPMDEKAEQRRQNLQTKLEQLISKQKKLQAKSDQDDPQMKKIGERIERVEKKLSDAEPATTLVMEERAQPRETFVLARGDYESPLEEVSAGTPEALPSPAGIPPTGDRLELARWLTSPENPLPARVTVNRWWGEFFGSSIVRTAEDFGTQADEPSHPQLLDWLASELIDSGWSRKHIHKLIVMSATFRQSAKASPARLKADPENRLLTRGPRFRLPAELVRDNALAISGLLSTKMYGAPIMPYQPGGIWRSVGRNQPTWQAAEDENRFRRGLYVVWKRAAPYPSFVNFDAPDRSSCTVHRPKTNTPLQALTLLNDPAYAEMALAFADRVLTETPELNDDAKVDYAIRLALSRDGTTQEIDLLQQLLESEREMLNGDTEQIEARTKPGCRALGIKTTDSAELAAWFAVANALLNLDETVTY